SELSAEEQQTILQHEAIHIDQKHSWDLLLFELLRIVFWFNPLVYMYQSRISILHEYIADAAAIKNQGKQAYYKGLLNQVFNTQNISFINTFFNQSLIKKRIVMLQKSRSKQTRLIKYALLIPLVFGMLIYTSCDTSETEVVEQEASVLEQIEGLKTTMEKNGGLTDEERAELLKLWLKTKDGNSELVLGENYYAEIKDESVEESIEVPYSVVEKAPVFPGCETSLDNGAQ